MSKTLFQNKTANEVTTETIEGDGAPTPLRFIGTFSTAVVVAHISTPLGVSKLTLSVDDTEQSTELKLFTGETAVLEITSADGSTDLSCLVP